MHVTAAPPGVGEVVARAVRFSVLLVVATVVGDEHPVATVEADVAAEVRVRPRVQVQFDHAPHNLLVARPVRKR